MATIRKFEDLDIWQLARQLSKEIKLLTDTEIFSKEFKLKDQMKRSSGSIMDNIAEGFDRDSRLEFVNFLSIAKGSCGELKSQLYRCLDYKLTKEENFNLLYKQTEEISAKIAGFIIYLNKSLIKGNKFKDRT
jgi:four helix bundle protein